MKKTANFSILIILVMIMHSCTTVPITGRKQLSLVPNSQMIQMGQQSYIAFLNETPAVNPPTVQSMQVEHVGSNISRAVETYFSANNMSNLIDGYNWEFKTVQSQQANAWCMPGGKVVVYTGILPITRDDNGLAVVVGHEIAHAVARHSNERMSQQLAIQLGGISLALALQQKPQATQQIFMSLYGVGSTLGQLAYSRSQELEADKLGLIFMAMAGYDPTNALTFWQSMTNNQSSPKVAEILSTHPSDERRIAELQKFLPEAMKYYRPGAASQSPTTTGTTGNTGTTVKPSTGVKISAPKNTAPPSKYGIRIK